MCARQAGTEPHLDSRHLEQGYRRRVETAQRGPCPLQGAIQRLVPDRIGCHTETRSREEPDRCWMYHQRVRGIDRSRRDVPGYRCVLLSDCMAEVIGADLPRSKHEASLMLMEMRFGWVTT